MCAALHTHAHQFSWRPDGWTLSDGLRGVRAAGERRSRARMTVAKMKGGKSGRETLRSERREWVMCGAISRVCQLEDKPCEAERLPGKRKKGCCAQWGVYRKGNCVCLSVCVRGWQRYSPHQRSYGRKKKKKNRYVWLRSDWDGERRGYLNPPTPPDWEHRSAWPNLQFWTTTLGVGDRFPLTAAGFRDGGSICHLQILEETMLRGALGAKRDSELRVFAV